MSNLMELGKKFKAIRDAHDAAKLELDRINSEWEECESAIIDMLVEEGVNSIDIDGVGKIILTTKSYLNVNAANKPSFYQYLKESGNGSILKEDVNPRTLQAFLKNHLEELNATVMEAYNLDEIDARNKNLEFLKSKGAAYFSEKALQFRKG